MFYHAYRHSWLGKERYVGNTIIGWKIFYRVGQMQRLQRTRVVNPSRFGALRELIRTIRLWHGKVFVLHVESIDAITEAHYELCDD